MALDVLSTNAESVVSHIYDQKYKGAGSEERIANCPSMGNVSANYFIDSRQRSVPDAGNT